MPHTPNWCFLKSDSNPKFLPPPTIPSLPSFVGLPLQLNGVRLGPNAPSSGLTVSYTLYRYITSYSYWSKESSIRYECTTPYPFDAYKKLMEFANMVHYEGKFYATSLQGALVVMQVIDMRLKITGVGALWDVPSIASRFFKDYLVGMEGEILLVFLIHHKSLAVVDHVEVFRFDLNKLDWIKVERLRGKTMMFLKERCVWVESAEFGCRDDCAYFTKGKKNMWKNMWRVFDMKDRCISSVLLEK